MINIMRTTSNSGSALHILLLAIVLFAAVSAVITQSGKGGSDILRPEKAKLYAGEIISYANQVSQAVRKVMLVNNCSDTQISFEGAPFDGSDTNYVNPNAPSDFSCHIFHPNGGGMAKRNISNGYTNLDITFPRNICIPYLGSGTTITNCASNSDHTELLMLIPEKVNSKDTISEEICKAINFSLGIEGIPEDGGCSTNNSFFNGTYSTGYTINSSPAKNSGCFVSECRGTHGFYHVLIQR
jgi:hypothetical protein